MCVARIINLFQNQSFPRATKLYFGGSRSHIPVAYKQFITDFARSFKSREKLFYSLQIGKFEKNCRLIVIHFNSEPQNTLKTNNKPRL